MTSAEATIQSSILNGLAERAHLTGANLQQADLQVPDIIKAMFDKPVRWAVAQYLAELEEQENAN